MGELKPSAEGLVDATAPSIADAIVTHYETCFLKHGDSFRGVDWPTEAGALLRYRVMLGIIERSGGSGCSVLDFGCGNGLFLRFIHSNRITGVRYLGADASRLFVDHCRRSFSSETFFQVDVNEPARGLPEVDYIIANGVFTERLGRPYGEMFDMLSRTLVSLWSIAKKGIAFNVMSKHVDWERDDLFHVPFDEMAGWVRNNLSRNFSFRADYGLYEYTVYVWREPNNG